MQNRLERIKELIILHEQNPSNQFSNASETFSDFIILSIKLQESVENTNCENSVKHLARKNLVINIVSGLEQFFKDLLIQYEGRWDSNGLNKLLAEKITLGEAYDIFKDSVISKEIMVSKTTSFQSINSINSVYSVLLGGKDFFLELERFSEAVERTRSCNDIFIMTINKVPYWRKQLDELFNLRHKLVHEPSIHEELSVDRIGELLEITARIVGTSTKYFLRKFSEK